MKHKRWIALLLAAVLAVSAMSITAFAAESTENETETAAEKRAEKPGTESTDTKKRSRNPRMQSAGTPPKKLHSLTLV